MKLKFIFNIVIKMHKLTTKSVILYTVEPIEPISYT